MSVVYARLANSFVQGFVKKRNGEVRVGEVIKMPLIDELSSLDEKFIIIGVKEDIGPQLNNGNPGANEGFENFLRVFLNMQANSFFQQNVALGGVVGVVGEPDANRVEELDRFLEEVVSKVLVAKKVPIVIGGGHNNCLPIIRACKKYFNMIATVNVDPHADCRSTETRHSGNGFSTAILEGSLDAYGVFGLHKPYNNAFILEFLKEHDIEHSFFEETYGDVKSLIAQVSGFMKKHKNCGLEIDLDSIKDMPSSAKSAIGWTEEQLLCVVKEVKLYASYLHLTEGASDDSKVGKFLAYAVMEFINRA